jgi:hypothetical protein
MPHSGDFGWRERKHESNGCEKDGRRGGDRWTRGQLPPAAGPPPGPRSARGGAQDARSDPRDESLGLPCTRPARVEPGPPGALSAAGCPAARAKAPSGQPRAGPPGLAARLTRPGSADPAADGRAPPRRARAGAARRSQPQAPRRRLARFGTSPACEDVRNATPSPPGSHRLRAHRLRGLATAPARAAASDHERDAEAGTAGRCRGARVLAQPTAETLEP